MIQAVLAAEDHRFFEHRGVDAVRIAGAAVTNVTGRHRYLVGASTLTQQLVKNTLLHPEQTVSRKLRAQALAMLLERRLSKARILELFLNEVYLGQQGSFAIHGVAQGARSLFGKDLRNITLGEAATMAGIIQAPQSHAPGRHPDRARTRRNGVLHAMVEQRFVTPDEALSAAREPIRAIADTLDVEAPYFVDLVDGRLKQALAHRAAGRTGVRVETTLDVHLQRLAETAVHERVVQNRRRARRGARRAATGSVDRRRPAERRDQGPRRRRLLSRLPVQSRGPGATTARFGRQAVRVPGGARTRPE